MAASRPDTGAAATAVAPPAHAGPLAPARAPHASAQARPLAPVPAAGTWPSLALPLLSAALSGMLPATGAAQVEARPLLEGAAYVGDVPMTDGVVVLHHISDGAQGELDSVRVGQDGRFAFTLPQAPDPERRDVFFASIRHDGVLYFGPAITRVLELDSIYEIHAYDTLMAPARGAEVAIESRSLFLEPDSGGVWRVTDLFQLRNDGNRTIVAAAGGRSWSYPLPEGASEVMMGEGDMALDVARYEDGALVVSAALSPGPRLFVARYRLPTPYVSFPTPGLIETLDVLVREPGPAVDVPGLEAAESIDLEGGGTFRRYAATDYAESAVEIVQGREVRPPPVELIAVLLTLVLAVGGLLALRSGGGPRPAPAPAEGGGRQALLLEVAHLDEEFEAVASPSEDERKIYRHRRAALLRRLRSGG